MKLKVEDLERSRKSPCKIINFGGFTRVFIVKGGDNYVSKRKTEI